MRPHFIALSYGYSNMSGCDADAQHLPECFFPMVACSAP